MKITITDLEGKAHRAKQPYEGANFVETNLTCPHCGTEKTQVAGTRKEIESHDTYRSDAIHYSPKCGKKIGVIRCKVATFFGLEEDERVFSMGVKIY